MRNFTSVIYFSSNEWDSFWIIQQPIANEFSKLCPVLFVERNVSVFTIIRYPKMWKKLFRWMRGARKINDNLYVISPIPGFHLGHKFPIILFIDYFMKAVMVKLFTALVPAFAKPLLFFDTPYYQKALRLFSGATTVYHVGDEISAFSTSDPRIMDAIEKSFLPKVSYVFCAATKLYEYKKQFNAQTHLIWNAIDHHMFDEKNIKTLEYFKNIKTPIIGFVGVVSTWFDSELFDAVTDLLPEYSFVIVGTFQKEKPAWLRKNNVYYLGSRHRTEIPSVMSAFDVGIIPFKKDRLVENILPLKYFEYLAAGKPIVATPFSPDLEKVQEFVTLAVTPNDFANALRRVIAEDSKDLVIRRKRIASESTWEHRVKEMLTIIET
jgi:glycosyltransferase involved in cell wall biosynthesis